MPTLSLEEAIKHLHEIRVQSGEEAYRKAVKDFAVTLIGTPNSEIFLSGFLAAAAEEGADWLDIEELQKEAAERQPKTPNMAELIRQMVPSIRTQAQYDLYMTAFQGLSMLMEAYYSHRDADAAKIREGLNQILDRAARVADVTEKAAEIPLEQQSAGMRDFTQPPAQYTEVEDQRRLLAELESQTTPTDLNTWYQSERPRFDKVVTPKYRNELFDAIRAKKSSLETN